MTDRSTYFDCLIEHDPVFRDVYFATREAYGKFGPKYVWHVTDDQYEIEIRIQEDVLWPQGASMWQGPYVSGVEDLAQARRAVQLMELIQSALPDEGEDYDDTL